LTWLHLVFDWRKIYETILQKAFCFILCKKFKKWIFSDGEICFLEIGHRKYKKIRDFYADFKNENLSSDKMLPKKIKILFPFF
jgi:hypothetical protein